VYKSRLRAVFSSFPLVDKAQICRRTKSPVDSSTLTGTRDSYPHLVLMVGITLVPLWGAPKRVSDESLLDSGWGARVEGAYGGRAAET
jgi:hypothetical protein